MRALELRKKSSEELDELLLEYSKELFNLRMQRGLSSNVLKPHLFGRVKRNIARVKTIMREKEGNNE
ncbi:MAG: 50S ribosomal protein L29 [Gammaproteobacteria bacterium RIFCSPHIGHO2_12_FULL_41_15]|nr:MAG: 50S ribosomal protein L29 [Gammaproteobacteria bacterium RIFCSPHIGHO2_12_FULL_41_15]